LCDRCRIKLSIWIWNILPPGLFIQLTKSRSQFFTVNNSTEERLIRESIWTRRSLRLVSMPRDLVFRPLRVRTLMADIIYPLVYSANYDATILDVLLLLQLLPSKSGESLSMETQWIKEVPHSLGSRKSRVVEQKERA